MFTPPAEVSAVLAAFALLFTEPSWLRAQALVCGTLLAPANHTLSAALRALGLAQAPGFQNFHRLLNRSPWSARQAAGVLLGLLVEAFVPAGPVILGLDELLERRRGRKLTARAIHYDPVHSSKTCFQKSSGLRWMCVALLAPVSWAAQVWALPFLTALCPSQRYGPYQQRGRRHKPRAERARGLLGQVRRWLPRRALIVVADSNYAVLELLAWCARRTITVISRLRLDAALYRPAPARRPGQAGRRRLKGKATKKLSERLTDRHTRWQTVQLPWYGQPARRLRLASGTAVWYDGGKPPVAIRWVLVRDPKNVLPPKKRTRHYWFSWVFVGWALRDSRPSNSLGFFALGLHRQGPAGRLSAARPAVRKAAPALEVRPRIALPSGAAPRTSGTPFRLSITSLKLVSKWRGVW
jgi:hypothetical protein